MTPRICPHVREVVITGLSTRMKCAEIAKNLKEKGYKIYQRTVERMRSHLDITTRRIVLSLPIQIRTKKILRPHL